MNNQKFGLIRVRIGKLVENYVVDKYKLFYNTRQHSLHRGFYDAYNKNTLYEIKAIQQNKYAKCVLIKNNHKKLMKLDGNYIFIIYKLKTLDSGLRMITDIKINNEIIINANIVDTLISGEWKRKNSTKIYCRVLLSKILEYEG